MPAPRLPWVKLWLTTRIVAKTSMLQGELFKSWTFLLMAAAEQPVRGRFDSPEHAAQCAGRPLAHVKDLIARGLLDAESDGLWMHHWKEHQEVSPSDVSRDRSGKAPTNPPSKGRHSLGNDSAETPVEASLEKREERRESNSPHTPPQGAVSDPRIDEVFEHWRATIKPNGRLTPEARRKIAARLKTFTVAELKEGIDRFGRHGWQMEHNGSRPADWFFHSDQRSETYRDLKPENVVALRPGARPQPVVQELDVYVREAM